MEKIVIDLDGLDFDTLEGFFEYFSRAALNCSWGRNLDAFNDVLRGGFGTPPEGFVLNWINHQVSMERLGYSETIRQLETRIRSCHHGNIPAVRLELAAARKQQGQTVSTG